MKNEMNTAPEQDMARLASPRVNNFFAHLKLLEERRYAELDGVLNGAQQAFERGEISENALRDMFALDHLHRVDLLPNAREWVTEYPDSYAANHVLFNLLGMAAWEARGILPGRYLTSRRVDLMHEYFEEGAEFGRRALELSAFPLLTIRHGIQVETASGREWGGLALRAIAEPFLVRSVTLCTTIMWAENPKWSGDENRLHEFYETIREWAWEPAQKARLHASYLAEKADSARCQEGGYRQALFLLEAAEQADPSTGFADEKGELYTLLGEPELAEPCLVQAIHQLPLAHTYKRLGTLWLEAGRAESGQWALEQAIKIGHGDATTTLATHLQERPGRPDLPLIESLLESGKAQYSSHAHFVHGCLYYDGDIVARDIHRACEHWHEAGAWGSTRALTNLADFYLFGRVPGIAADPVLGRQYAEAACELDDVGGFDLLGRYLWRNARRKDDYAEALPMLARAADANHPVSLRFLAKSLWFGLGTAVDRPAARYWMDRLKAVDLEKYKFTRSEIRSLTGWSRSFAGSIRDWLAART